MKDALTLFALMPLFTVWQPDNFINVLERYSDQFKGLAIEVVVG